MDEVIVDLGDVTAHTMAFVQGTGQELTSPFKCLLSTPKTVTNPL